MVTFIAQRPKEKTMRSWKEWKVRMLCIITRPTAVIKSWAEVLTLEHCYSQKERVSLEWKESLLRETRNQALWLGESCLNEIEI